MDGSRPAPAAGPLEELAAELLDIMLKAASKGFDACGGVADAADAEEDEEEDPLGVEAAAAAAVGFFGAFSAFIIPFIICTIIRLNSGSSAPPIPPADMAGRFPVSATSDLASSFFFVGSVSCDCRSVDIPELPSDVKKDWKSDIMASSEDVKLFEDEDDGVEEEEEKEDNAADEDTAVVEEVVSVSDCEDRCEYGGGAEALWIVVAAVVTMSKFEALVDGFKGEALAARGSDEVSPRAEEEIEVVEVDEVSETACELVMLEVRVGSVVDGGCCCDDDVGKANVDEEEPAAIGVVARSSSLIASSRSESRDDILMEQSAKIV